MHVSLARTLGFLQQEICRKIPKDNEDLVECTKGWSAKEEPLKKDKSGMYATSSLSILIFFPLQCYVDYLGSQISTSYRVQASVIHIKIVRDFSAKITWNTM